MTKKILFLFLFILSSIIYADSISIILENDTLTFPNNKDSEYTHGTEVTYMSNSSLWIFNDVGFEVEQTMYGPKLDKTDNMYQGEHPYCGYLSLNLLGEQYFDYSFGMLTLQHSLGFGLVGPHSYSEQSQKYIHKILGCKDPKGWKKWQIRDEAIVQYELYANLNIPLYEYNSFKLYGIPRAGVDVGGFKDMIAAGFDLKLGFNTPYNVGSGLILSAPMQKDDWNLWILAGVEGRCVFHDTAIEGGLFRDSPYTLDAEKWVGEFHYGVGIKIYDFEIEYKQVIRSKEFETNYRKPNYGRFVITYNF